MRREDVKIRRRLRISIFVICVLGVWLKNVYDDRSFIESDIDMYKIALCNKDTGIMILNKEIDSLQKVKRRIKTVFIYPVKKEFKNPIPVIDTIAPIIDTNRVIVDTLRSE